MSLRDVRAHQRRLDDLIRRIESTHRRLADDVAQIATRADSVATSRMAAKQIRRRIERAELDVAFQIREHVREEARRGIRVAVQDRGVRTTLGQVDRMRGTVLRQINQEYDVTATRLVKRYANDAATDIGRYVRRAKGDVNAAEVKRMVRMRQRDYLPQNAPGEGISRSLSSNVKRVVTSNSNRAFRRAQDVYGERAGAIGVKWHLNPRHPKPDPCDTLANQDLYGLGPGMYPPGSLPQQPHPYCRCWAETIWPEEDTSAA